MLKESAATLLVRFTGLGILVFNKEKKRGEIAILRDEKHKLSVKLQRPQFQDGSDRDVIIYKEIAQYSDLPKDSVSLEITTPKGSAVDGFETYSAAGEFNRLESDDSNDIRWLVNMTELHGEPVAVSKATDRFPISKLFINNGLFYVQRLDPNMPFEKITRDSDGNEVHREVFGYVAETVGTIIDAPEVSVRICIDGKEETHSLTRNEGLPFRLEISNMNYDEDAVTSDMPDYYKYFTSPDGKRFEFELMEDDASGGSVNGRMYCHLIDGGDIGSIDELEN